MKISHICPTFHTEFAHWHEKIVQQQAFDGHDLEVITTTLYPNGDSVAHKSGVVVENGIKIKRISAKKVKNQIIPVGNPCQLRTNADVLHLHSYGQLLPELSALLNPRIPKILKADVGAVYPDTNPLKRIERKLIDAVTVFDNEEARYVEEMGFHPDQIHKIPHGVDFGRFNEAGKINDPVDGRVLMVCQIIPDKNIELAIEALSELPKETTLRIVGPVTNEPYYKEVKRKIKQEDVQEQIDFVGLIPHEQIQEEFARAEVILVTSSSESGGPASMLEAAATGRPVVSVPLSLREELSEGIVSVSYDSSEVSKTLRLLQSDKDFWEKRASMAETIAKEYNWGKLAQTLEELYIDMKTHNHYKNI